jgi:transposase
LRAGLLEAVYHGSQQTETLKQLVHNYESLTEDATRCMNRLKAVFRSQGVMCSGRDVYYTRSRAAWLEKLTEEGLRLRAEFLSKQLDHLRELRGEAKKSLLEEARKQAPFKRLCMVPGLGPIRVAQFISVIGSPHRFRTKRQLWTYCGFAVVTRSSSDYEIVGDKLERRHKHRQARGLNPNYSRRLKMVFKGAAVEALKEETFKKMYERLMASSVRAEMARLTIARKLAAVALAIWKNGEKYDETKLSRLTA